MAMTHSTANLEHVIINMNILARVPHGGKIKTQTGHYLEVDEPSTELIRYTRRRLAGESVTRTCMVLKALVQRTLTWNKDEGLNLQQRLDLTNAMHGGLRGINMLANTSYHNHPKECVILQRQSELLQHALMDNYTMLVKANPTDEYMRTSVDKMKHALRETFKPSVLSPQHPSMQHQINPNNKPPLPRRTINTTRNNNNNNNDDSKSLLSPPRPVNTKHGNTKRPHVVIATNDNVQATAKRHKHNQEWVIYLRYMVPIFLIHVL